MLSLYSVLASKPWGRPENTKRTMGMHQKFRAPWPTFHTDRADHWSLLFAGREASQPQPVCQCQRFLQCFALNTFSFLDAKRARNQLQWIGKTWKMAGTSGNSFNGSYRVHSFPFNAWFCGWWNTCCPLRESHQHDQWVRSNTKKPFTHRKAQRGMSQPYLHWCVCLLALKKAVTPINSFLNPIVFLVLVCRKLLMMHTAIFLGILMGNYCRNIDCKIKHNLETNARHIWIHNDN